MIDPMPEYSPPARLTVGELVEELSELDPTMLVLVNGYEGGYQAPSVLKRRVVDLDHGAKWRGYCGPWEDVDRQTPARTAELEPGAETAVIISRGDDER
jgi:hypothetical protein